MKIRCLFFTNKRLLFNLLFLRKYYKKEGLKMKIGMITTIVSIMSLISFVVYCCLVIGAQEDRQMEDMQHSLYYEDMDDDYC